MRLVAFSDGVFAISITLLVLEIKPPTDYGNLLHGLAVLWRSYVVYVVTFLFVGQVWVNHHMFDHIRAADRVIWPGRRRDRRPGVARPARFKIPCSTTSALVLLDAASSSPAGQRSIESVVTASSGSSLNAGSSYERTIAL